MNRFLIRYSSGTLLNAILGKICEDLGLCVKEINSSALELIGDIDETVLQKANAALQDLGIELVPKVEGQGLAVNIKSFIIEIVDDESTRKQKLSALLTEKFGYSYTHLSSTFSKTYFMSIEKFFIMVKIERVKTMLLEGHKLADAVEVMDYSSVQHLSRQFKDITGLSVTQFLKMVQLRLN